MICPVCLKIYCDHTPKERSQSFEEMMRPPEVKKKVFCSKNREFHFSVIDNKGLVIVATDPFETVSMPLDIMNQWLVKQNIIFMHKLSDEARKDVIDTLRAKGFYVCSSST